jgi:hypothetical protein
VLIWLPPRAPRYMWGPYSWDPKTALMESILTLGKRLQSITQQYQGLNAPHDNIQWYARVYQA